MNHVGPGWTRMVLYGPGWTWKNHVGPGRTWMDQDGPLWSRMDLDEPCWTWMDQVGLYTGGLYVHFRKQVGRVYEVSMSVSGIPPAPTFTIHIHTPAMTKANRGPGFL